MRNGVVRSVDEFVETMLAKSVHPTERVSASNIASQRRLSAKDWAHQFEEWADSFPEAPPIPDEALSRENLYPDRW